MVPGIDSTCVCVYAFSDPFHFALKGNQEERFLYFDTHAHTFSSTNIVFCSHKRAFLLVFEWLISVLCFSNPESKRVAFGVIWYQGVKRVSNIKGKPPLRKLPHFVNEMVSDRGKPKKSKSIPPGLSPDGLDLTEAT